MTGAGSPLTEPEVFLLADHALNDVVAQIRDEQWSMEMPASFATRASDHRPTLREIINYHAYDDAWVPDMLAGRTMAEVGVDRFKGDLLGDEPKLRFAEIVDKACAAAKALDDLERTVHCSFGDFPARGYLWQTNMFRGLPAHDIAKVIGIDFDMPDALVQGIWEEISPQAEKWRAIGIFPKAVPVPEDAPLLDRLLGLTGRNPQKRG
ncbi:MAG: TIGR03086 family protein [Candidatus Dormibacterales bacterium]